MIIHFKTSFCRPPSFLSTFQSSCLYFIHLYLACHVPSTSLCPRHTKRTKTQTRPSKAQIQEPGLEADSHEKPQVLPPSEMRKRVLSPHTVQSAILAHRKVLPMFHPGMKLKVPVPGLLHLQLAQHLLSQPDLGSCFSSFPPNKITF